MLFPCCGYPVLFFRLILISPFIPADVLNQHHRALYTRMMAQRDSLLLLVCLLLPVHTWGIVPPTEILQPRRNILEVLRKPGTTQKRRNVAQPVKQVLASKVSASVSP
eukprot:4782569-Pyramimonas_sp.AAC.1